MSSLDLRVHGLSFRPSTLETIAFSLFDTVLWKAPTKNHKATSKKYLVSGVQAKNREERALVLLESAPNV